MTENNDTNRHRRMDNKTTEKSNAKGAFTSENARKDAGSYINRSLAVAVAVLSVAVISLSQNETTLKDLKAQLNDILDTRTDSEKLNLNEVTSEGCRNIISKCDAKIADLRADVTKINMDMQDILKVNIPKMKSQYEEKVESLKAELNKVRTELQGILAAQSQKANKQCEDEIANVRIDLTAIIDLKYSECNEKIDRYAAALAIQGESEEYHEHRGRHGCHKHRHGRRRHHDDHHHHHHHHGHHGCHHP